MRTARSLGTVLAVLSASATIAGAPGAAAPALPEFDAVLIASRIPDAGGKMRWPVYDCEANAWKAAILSGDEPIGKQYNVSLRLMYGARRKLVWAADSYAGIWALRPNLRVAGLEPIGETAGGRPANP